PSALSNVRCEALGLLPTAPKKIRSSPAADGSPNVLIQNKSGGFFPTDWFGRLVVGKNGILKNEESQSSFRKIAFIGRDRASRRGRNSQVGQRFSRAFFEENIAWVEVK